MTEPPGPNLEPESRFRLFYLFLAIVNFSLVLTALFREKNLEAEHFVAGLMWSFLFVERAEWRAWSKWLVWGLLIIYIVLVVVNALH